MSPLSVLLAVSASIAYSAQWKAENEALHRGDYGQAIAFFNDSIFVIGTPHYSSVNICIKVTTDQCKFVYILRSKQIPKKANKSPQIYTGLLGSIYAFLCHLQNI